MVLVKSASANRVNPKTTAKPAGGYTLVELLVAVALLGVVIAPFFALFSGSFFSIINAGRRTAAINLCREQIEVVRAARPLPEEPAAGHPLAGTETDLPGYPGFERTTSVSTVNGSCANNPELQLDLHLVEITVAWQFREKEFSEKLSCYLARSVEETSSASP